MVHLVVSESSGAGSHGLSIEQLLLLYYCCYYYYYYYFWFLLSRQLYSRHIKSDPGPQKVFSTTYRYSKDARQTKQCRSTEDVMLISVSKVLRCIDS